ncbi:unnamed protein product (macronuclear) [Paramecium tetraurelia]|uniref:Uncharacterized protein n=1 Tax=Paramecium tetraurelia TaxID=5888 RepID=A0C1S4_PARTE|nr:uncharacterized protein GSPATT00034218001 [Paramecium tetraurelia]CAK64741.1 unnamed protein product [Paramecium tetraurelia]|eukprot:XP_001432138.1 hypothetical protein (macronuclear) [Paramecium tetraurelia strain d4-2]
MSDQYQKAESQENSSQLSSQDEQQQKTIKPAELVALPKVYAQSLNNEQPSTREERKMKQYLQRIQEQERLEDAATLKKKRTKPNPPQKQQDNLELPVSAENGENVEDEGILLNPPAIQLNPQVLQTEQQSEIQTQQLKMRLNPKLKIKEKHHVYIYLANCQDQSLENVQELTSKATQFYSPQKQLKEQSSLNQINQEIFQETTIIIKNIKNQYQQYIDQTSNGNSNDQKDFVIKYLDKKYIESVVRESKMQIQRKQTNDKQLQNGKKMQSKY